jgi:two-component system chemotaxis sensor kinase CheA
MDVVNNTIRELGGTLSLETEKNRGVRFSLRLPLTLAIADVLILSAHDQTCAVPQSFIHEVLQLDESSVRKIRDTEVIPYRDGILPIVRLRSVLGAEPSDLPMQPALVLKSDRGSTGLVVDRIHGQREVVVRALNDPLVRVPVVAGATELGDGRPVLILDAAALTSGTVRPGNGERSADDKPEALAITT